MTGVQMECSISFMRIACLRMKFGFFFEALTKRRQPKFGLPQRIDAIAPALLYSS